MSHLLETSTIRTARPVLRVHHAPYDVFLVRVNWAVDLAKESWSLVRSNDTHSTKVSEVPTPRGQGIQLLLKMSPP